MQFDLHERAQARAAAVRTETAAIAHSFADPAPTTGPRPRR